MVRSITFSKLLLIKDEIEYVFPICLAPVIISDCFLVFFHNSNFSIFFLTCILPSKALLTAVRKTAKKKWQKIRKTASKLSQVIRKTEK